LPWAQQDNRRPGVGVPAGHRGTDANGPSLRAILLGVPQDGPRLPAAGMVADSRFQMCGGPDRPPDSQEHPHDSDD
jgi:hypothetical protein